MEPSQEGHYVVTVLKLLFALIGVSYYGFYGNNKKRLGVIKILYLSFFTTGNRE